MSNFERDLLERVYNLCDKSDYDEYYIRDVKIMSYEAFTEAYYYFYTLKNGGLHNFDGPCFMHTHNNVAKYYVYGVFLSEEEFNNHEKVKQYRYLKEHPEIEGFL